MQPVLANEGEHDQTVQGDINSNGRYFRSCIFMKKKIMALGLSTVLLFGMLNAQADDLSDLQDEAAYSQSQIEALNGSIDTLQAEKSIVLGQIDMADQELVLTIATISTLNEQIAIKNTEIAETTVALQDAEDREATEYEAMRLRGADIDPQELERYNR